MTTQQTTWTIYNGSDEQIAELKSNKQRLFRYKNGVESDPFVYIDTTNHPDFRLRSTIQEEMSDVVSYWLIPDDPLREMKVRWSQTGQPVWVRVYKQVWHDEYSVDEIYITTTPDWTMPNAEYAFTEFKD